MDRNNRVYAKTATLDMKSSLLPLLTLLVLGQIVYIFTAFDVAGAAADLAARLLG